MRFAMYSESYLPGLLLNATSINTLFQNEVVNVSRDKCYMGIWQLFALSSILKRPIVSVYPQLGNPSVRMDLNRTIFPREEQRSNKAFIMCISTRTDMVHVHWVPNHFIPVLPIDVVHKPSDIEIQRWRLKAQRTKEKVKTEKDMNSNGMLKSAEEEKKTEHQESFLEKNTEHSRRKTAHLSTKKKWNRILPMKNQTKTFHI